MTASPFVCPLPDMQTRPAGFKVPSGAVDSHCHIYAPPTRHPYRDIPSYVPPQVTVDDYIRMLDALGISRGVLVHAAIFADNSVVLEAMRMHPTRFRAIAIVDETVTDGELELLHLGGCRGFRVNLVSRVGIQWEAARRLASRVRHLGWHVQFLLDCEAFPSMDIAFQGFPVDVVIDHMGRPDVARGVAAPGFQALIRLLRGGHAWTKFSAPYRTSKDPIHFHDMIPFAREIIDAASDRIVWGSDWPHVNMGDARMPNDGELLGLLGLYTHQQDLRDRILVGNPEKLYGFEPMGALA